MKYVAQRIALGLISLLLLSMMVYAAAQVLPGDPGRAVLGREATPAAVKEFNHKIGYDEPLPTRYAKWLEHAVQGFGLYQSSKRRLDPVLRELGQSRAGWAAGSQFVFSQHCKSLRGLGVDDERIAAVPHWPAADCFT